MSEGKLVSEWTQIPRTTGGSVPDSDKYAIAEFDNGKTLVRLPGDIVLHLYPDREEFEVTHFEG